MCCRSNIVIADLSDHLDEIAVILDIAGFKKDPTLWTWTREFPPSPSGMTRRILVNVTSTSLSFSLVPSISTHDIKQHTDAAFIASVQFQILAVIGEKFGGTVEQTSLVGVCRDEGGMKRTLAVYPDEPMRHENICAGFRAVLRRGVGMVEVTYVQEQATSDPGSTASSDS